MALAGTGVLIITGVTAFLWVQRSTRTSGHPKQYVRQGFSFEYPAAWTVDDQDKDHDPDHMFSIDASEGAMAMFVIADGELNLGMTLQAQVKLVFDSRALIPSSSFATSPGFSRVGVAGGGKCSATLLP